MPDPFVTPVAQAPFDGVYGRRTFRPIARPGETVLLVLEADTVADAGARLSSPHPEQA